VIIQYEKMISRYFNLYVILAHIILFILCSTLDEATLLFCISLLDHSLYKDIYDSAIIGFLAVLGIGKDGRFLEATSYTSRLSAFINIA
jgi:hypothetical protein